MYVESSFAYRRSITNEYDRVELKTHTAGTGNLHERKRILVLTNDKGHKFIIRMSPAQAVHLKELL